MELQRFFSKKKNHRDTKKVIIEKFLKITYSQMPIVAQK